MYQVQAPDLSRPHDLSRIEKMRGDKLSADNLSAVGGDNLSDRADKSGKTDGAGADKSGSGEQTTCLPEVVKGTYPSNYEGPKEVTACAETSSAPTTGPAVEAAHVHSVECECHPNPFRPRIDGVMDESYTRVLVPLVGSAARPFALTDGLLIRLARDYPGVDAQQTARNIRNWCLDHPRRRKTPGGVAGFVTAWFIREQNRASRGAPPSRAGAATTRTAQNVAAAAAFARGDGP